MLAVLAPPAPPPTAAVLSRWLAEPAVADRLGWWSVVTGIDLVGAGTDPGGDGGEATRQPLLTAVALAAADAVLAGDPPEVAAGHGRVGHLVAAVLAGALAPEAALGLARLVAGPGADRPAVMAALRGATVSDPRTRLLCGPDATLARTGEEIRSGLPDRLVGPHPAPDGGYAAALAELGVTGLLRLEPGQPAPEHPLEATGAGPAELTLRTPAELPAARGFVAAHSDRSPGLDHHGLGHEPAWRVVVAPATGTFQPRPGGPDEALAPGAALGQLAGRQGNHAVTAPHGGVVVEWLAEDGDPVRLGQPLARLHPGGLG